MKDSSLISVILPTLNFIDSTAKVLDALLTQSIKPGEVIIIDSSPNDNIEILSKKYVAQLNINFIKVSKAYPGEARNIGILNAKFDFIAFIDSKTVPESDWLKNYIDIMLSHDSHVDVIFGSTSYLADTKFQNILQSTIYGKKPVETTPGTIIQSKSLHKIGNFVEKVRASDDLEWRNRIKESDLNYISPMNGILSYSEISRSFISELKRHFIYQFHSALTEVQMNTKIFMLGVTVLLISLIIPHWNALIGWKDSFFYVPHITRGFFYIFSIFSIILLSSSRFIKIRSSLSKFIVVIFIILFLNFASQWNEVMAQWADESFIYIPHITKIYIFSLILSGFLYRGIYTPLRGGLKFNALVPFNWIIFGVVGFLLDLAKLPGYFFGAIYAIFRTFRL